MNTKLIEEIASAVLYEGYLLYPYRASALKNQQRWNFGVLYPRAYAEQQSGADAWRNQTECLVRAGSDAKLSVRVRFLQLGWQAEAPAPLRPDVGQAFSPANPTQAQERDITLSSLRLSELAAHPGRLQITQPLDALIETEATLLDRDLYKIRISVSNTSTSNVATRDEALMHSLVSAHSIIGIEGGAFVSLLDPPDELRNFAAACENVGTWPVLVGEDGQRDAILSSPIILYDYPKIAPESPGALFDGTEIDEILTLRILTLTDEEKREISRSDERARQILERTESMPAEQFMKMHGVVRNLREVQEQTP
jgi:hypothetical protein